MPPRSNSRSMIPAAPAAGRTVLRAESVDEREPDEVDKVLELIHRFGPIVDAFLGHWTAHQLRDAIAKDALRIMLEKDPDAPFEALAGDAYRLADTALRIRAREVRE